MNTEKLKQHLIKDTTRLFCVLDGASVPKLPVRLFESQTPNFCLFKGELEPDMLYVAPYLVQLKPDNKFTDWVLNEGFGKHWGIFVHCRDSIKEMRGHFRSLVNVYDEQANSMIFRFYDPRVLNRFLPTCDAEQLKVIFGNVATFFAENGQNLSSFQLENDNLKQTDLN